MTFDYRRKARPKTIGRFVPKHYRSLEHLPDPDQVWTVDDVDDAISEQVTLLSKNAIIKAVGRTSTVRNLTKWQTNAQAYEMVQEYLEANKDEDGFLPCGHSAMRNVDGQIECKRCSRSWPSDELS